MWQLTCWSNCMTELLRRVVLPALLLLIASIHYSSLSVTASKLPPQAIFDRQKCILGEKVYSGPPIRRSLRLSNQDEPLVLETSDRPVQKLLTFILGILLTEELGYEGIRLHQSPPTANPIDSPCQLSKNCSYSEKTPDSMVNVALALTRPLSQWALLDDTHVNVGLLGPKLKPGWFMSPSTSDGPEQPGPQYADHWLAFRNSSIARRFSLDPQDGAFIEMAAFDQADNAELTSLCEQATCKNGILHSRFCPSQSDCALLLSDRVEHDGPHLQRQIESLQLKINIAWIGDHFENYIETHSRSLKKSLTAPAVLFYDWHPSLLTTLNRFSPIHLKECLRSRNEKCSYEPLWLHKTIWYRLKSKAPEVHFLVHKMLLTQLQLEEMVDVFRSVMRENATLELHPHDENVLYEAACLWVNRRQDVWRHHWLDQHRPIVNLAMLVPLSGPYWRQNGLLPAIDMAVSSINKNTSLLPSYTLGYHIFDSKCQTDYTLRAYIELLLDKIPNWAGIVGPGCSNTAQTLASVSKHFDLVMISYGADSMALSRSEHPYFFRTVPKETQNNDVYIEVLSKLGWRSVALLSGESSTWSHYHSEFERQLTNNSISVAVTEIIPSMHSFDDAEKVLNKILAKKTKIIILTMYEHVARHLFCRAYRKKMTAHYGYQWFVPSWFTDHWYKHVENLYQHSNADDRAEKCTAEEMIKAVEGYISLEPSYLGDMKQTIISNMTVSEWKEQYEAEAEKGINNSHLAISAYASFAYDAIYTFATALDKLLAEDPLAIHAFQSVGVRAKLMKLIADTNFWGASGHVTFMQESRARIPIKIYQYRCPMDVERQTCYDTHLVKKFIGRIRDSADSEMKLDLKEDSIVWLNPGGTAPKSPEEVEKAQVVRKTCHVEAFRQLLNVECDTAIVVANILGVGMFGLLMLLALIVVKRRYDSKVRATRARMAELGLMSDASWLCLDSWEIPREHVVLNRKLGEGAFGTVYGGEALIDDNWVAVAVKTLKIGSHTEEKLDFLGEAEMMKRFTHENIVKLLGVCTRGEPAHTIMEFMLHGDLKTFLLARRQLVGHNSKEAEDVMPAALTRMSLDVSYGLSYLTNNKFVHRDLACRNCLVHASKRVKIGDFGMARPMYESDYYRFNKRGMLPVRWMAPESLGDGMFTAMSDIWSYGILLYEILTFGSFPYQGLSNKQVLEHVRSGKTLSLPENCNAKLKELVQMCWSFHPDARPSIDTVVQIFLDNSELLQPCLDAPVAAVATEALGSIEMAIPSRSSHHRLWGSSKADRSSSLVRSPTSLSASDNNPMIAPGSCGSNGLNFRMSLDNDSMESRKSRLLRHDKNGSKDDEEEETEFSQSGIGSNGTIPTCSGILKQGPGSPVKGKYIAVSTIEDEPRSNHSNSNHYMSS